MGTTDRPVTRATAQALASDLADDPSTVVEIVHPGFNTDLRGGYAFRCDRGLVIYGFDGARAWRTDPGNEPGRFQEIEQYWREARHRHRPLGLDAVSGWHRAAIAAVASGRASVAELPPSARPGVTDVARADYLMVVLRRCAPDRTESSMLRALAADDRLLEVPAEHHRAHRCPLCGRAAIGQHREYVSVCDDCYPSTVCRCGRPVTGHNTSISGGFEAQHVDDGTVCDQVTRDGGVRVDGRECRMGEARFGGVFVGVVVDGAVG
jgi:hypothetical protein